MASRVKNMTQGNPTWLILMFSLPILAGTVLQQLYNLVDTMVLQSCWLSAAAYG